jgi:hypothetical protein
LFQTARLDPVSYRFDSLPDGTSEVDLRSAETDGRRPGRRSFDVYLDDQLVLPSHDIAGEVGYTADRHTLFVEVTRRTARRTVRAAPRLRPADRQRAAGHPPARPVNRPP